MYKKLNAYSEDKKDIAFSAATKGQPIKEKTDPVSVMAARTFLNRYENPIITVHDKPDVDALSSAIGLALWLKNIGKSPAILLSEKEQKFIPRFLNGIVKKNELVLAEKLSAKNDAIIAVDTAIPDRVHGLDQAVLKKLPVLDIDHHEKGKLLTSPQLSLISSKKSASTTELLYRYIISEENITPDIAVCLIAGLCADTQRLDFNVKSNTQETAGELIDYLLNNQIEKYFPEIDITMAKKLNEKDKVNYILNKIDDHNNNLELSKKDLDIIKDVVVKITAGNIEKYKHKIQYDDKDYDVLAFSVNQKNNNWRKKMLDMLGRGFENYLVGDKKYSLNKRSDFVVLLYKNKDDQWRFSFYLFNRDLSGKINLNDFAKRFDEDGGGAAGAVNATIAQKIIDELQQKTGLDVNSEQFQKVLIEELVRVMRKKGISGT